MADSSAQWQRRQEARTERTEYSGRKTLVLCLDGTGNKFTGNDGDSNIIKIFSMLDRQDINQHVYYQPGIGTYVQSSSYSHTSTFSKIRSWYLKAKDSAIGTSFEHHVMGAYTFLMRYYQPGDDIYLFGFSRGAYTARFLAQMLDFVGLLSAGNEELLRFAWKTFAQWQTRQEDTDKDKEQKEQKYEFMKKFRETFSIPVRRIRFIGLFDTVNSVPRFETAWMQRSKFPYTARSSAKVIRHAVSIDERRAKFRQDLIGQKKPSDAEHQHHHHHYHHSPHLHLHHHEEKADEKINGATATPRAPPSSTTHTGRFEPRKQSVMSLEPPKRGRIGSVSPAATASTASLSSITSQTPAENRTAAGDEDDEDERAPQDIQEVWFPGCHADIGGGWPLLPGEEVSISHAPLIWMIREARKAGLPFDEDALRSANYVLDEPAEPESFFQNAQEAVQPDRKQSQIPVLEVEGEVIPASPPSQEPAGLGQRLADSTTRTAFREKFVKGMTKGRVHDVLQFKHGAAAGSVVSWNIMEYLPFRRMDLQPDGSWAPIRWPLPCGETRDIPSDAWIHGSALRRMEADPTYRPGNLIVGGGGRGLRKAPASAGTGKWKVLREEGDLVGEIVVRSSPAGDLAALEK